MIERRSLLLKTLLIGIAFALVLAYGFWQARQLLEGPIVTITSPTNGSTISDTHTMLTGTVQNVSYLTLNGRQIYADEKGIIKEPLLLPQGYNIIQISGADKFGRETTHTLKLVAQKEESNKEIVQNATTINVRN